MTVPTISPRLINMQAPVRANLAIAVDSTLQAGHHWTVTSGAGSIGSLNYTGDFVFGTQCIQLITTGADNPGSIQPVQISLPRQTALNLTNKHLRFWYKIPTGTAFGNMRMILGSGASAFLNNINCIVQANGTIEQEFASPGEWASFTCSPFQAGLETGTLDWTAIQDFRVQLADDGTGSTELRFGGIVIENNDTNYPNGLISFSWDDGLADIKTNAEPILFAAGFTRNTMYVIADKLDTAAYLTTLQAQTMQQTGWDMAGHAAFDADHGQSMGFVSLTEAQQIADFQAQRVNSTTNHFVGAFSHWAYPKGDQNIALRQTMAPWYSAARSTIGANLNRPFETLPPADTNLLRVYPLDLATVVTPHGTRNTAEWAVDQVKKYGGWLIFYGHSVNDVDSGNGQSIPVASFQTLVSYVLASGVPVKSVADVLYGTPSILNVGTSGGSPALATTGGAPSLATTGGAPVLATTGPVG